ncbi:hypothetical protein BU23DRAFT_651460 [Bimuria novae-zelandiae CBS 107.79]|uniref:Lanthionine synthetase C-like protein n=1 Tax=Bimuria novae-zelandiae CBS 107.79 TaxID=1447943 RepID=A0A6A5VMU1_9PLEO|nr:hypothetical protein BU23DRAFT_651460 [Bimuria novae-zelandiae CBS 107.79]
MDATITFKPHSPSPLRTLASPPRELLVQSLTHLTTEWPPEKAAQDTQPRMGFFQGPTSIAYLFFHLSKTHPQLEISGETATAWFELYFYWSALEAPREEEGSEQGIGIASEHFCHLALRAAHTQDASHFLSAVANTTLTSVQDLLVGSAGLLFLLRFVRFHVPLSAPLLSAQIARVIAHITATPSPWLFHGRAYTGAAHGDIGIITQICLSSPGSAALVKDALSALLDAQLENGNWYSTRDRGHEHLQWCHGAAGITLSLNTLKPFFPDDPMKSRIQAAVEKAQRLIFEKGVLVKEPCLCHGVMGNALALEGGWREHLLSFATPEEMEGATWEKSSDPMGLFCGEAGRAWVWAMVDAGDEGFPAYTNF